MKPACLGSADRSRRPASASTQRSQRTHQDRRSSESLGARLFGNFLSFSWLHIAYQKMHGVSSIYAGKPVARAIMIGINHCSRVFWSIVGILASRCPTLPGAQGRAIPGLIRRGGRGLGHRRDLEVWVGLTPAARAGVMDFRSPPPGSRRGATDLMPATRARHESWLHE